VPTYAKKAVFEKPGSCWEMRSVRKFNFEGLQHHTRNFFLVRTFATNFMSTELRRCGSAELKLHMPAFGKDIGLSRRRRSSVRRNFSIYLHRCLDRENDELSAPCKKNMTNAPVYCMTQNSFTYTNVRWVAKIAILGSEMEKQPGVTDVKGLKTHVRNFFF
jgi:hypothetical protein